MVCGINAACWNINGLYEIVRNERICKLDYTDVLTEINKHDIYCMQETHIGPEEKINVPHYFVHSITRPKNNRAIRHSGGLLLFIKESLKSKITIIPNIKILLAQTAEKRIPLSLGHLYIGGRVNSHIHVC